MSAAHSDRSEKTATAHRPSSLAPCGLVPADHTVRLSYRHRSRKSGSAGDPLSRVQIDDESRRHRAALLIRNQAMTASPRHGAWLSLNAHAPPPARQLLENVPPGLETMTLTLEKDKHRLPSDAHLAADSPSVWDALGVSHQSHLFVFYPLSQRSVTSHIFLLRVAGRGWSIAVITSVFPHIRTRT